MEELKKDVESAKVLSAHKTFLENVNDLGILKKKTIHDSTAALLMQTGSPDWNSIQRLISAATVAAAAAAAAAAAPTTKSTTATTTSTETKKLQKYTHFSS